MLKLVVDNTKPKQVKHEVRADPPCMFILQDIAVQGVDDFMVLPAERIFGNVYQGLQGPVQRHSDFWVHTH